MGGTRSGSGALPVRSPVPVLLAQAYLDMAVDDSGFERGLGRGRGTAYVPAVRQPENAAVPRALDASVHDRALGQRSGEVAAPLGQRVDRPAHLPDDQHRHVVHAAPDGPAGRELRIRRGTPWRRRAPTVASRQLPAVSVGGRTDADQLLKRRGGPAPDVNLRVTYGG
jgi:hypothetical protein